MSDRIPESSTQVIDRSKAVTLYYRNEPVRAFAGETVASALIASGVKVFSRSFKYHRPRGPFCLSGQCARCTMTVDGRMHVKICQIPVREGMRVEPQGDVDRDIKSLADKLSWAMPAGFYYKSLYKPKFVWKKAAKSLRKAPGNLGEVRPLTKKVRFDEVNLTPELLVVGGGLAGMEAALVGTKAGVRVVLIETEPHLGGFQRFQGPEGQGPVKELITQLEGHENLRILTSTTASSLYPDGLMVCIQSIHDDDFVERSWLVRPKVTVLATGTISRPLVFTNDDRPGIILPEAAQRLIHLWGLKPGRQALVTGGDDYMVRVALDLAAHGTEVVGVADYRTEGLGEPLNKALTEAGIEYLPGWNVSEAKGNRTVEGAEGTNLDGSNSRSFKCDLIVASAGRSPIHKLLGQAGSMMVHDQKLNLHLPQDLPPAYATAGRLLGLEDPEAIRAQGRLAGAEVLAGLGIDTSEVETQARAVLSNSPDLHPIARQPYRAKDKSKTFICFCSDTTERDIESALAEGFDKIETCKRYTTTTMGLCQGSMCQANFAELLATKRPELSAQTLTTPRAPAAPISFGAMGAGHHDQPRVTPIHHIQMAEGGKPFRAGPWIRVEHFGDPEAESLAVHQAAGFCDASTLGKFRVFGPDAERLLNRIFTTSVDKLTGNRILYYAACNEEGVFIDDGVALKLGEHDYYVTTSTARALTTMEWFSRWSREEDWQVWMVNLTETRAAMNLAGPKARDILSMLTEIDISNTALPYMHWTEIEVAGVEALVLRMGFLGELSLELHCPSSQATDLWKTLLKAGKPLGLKPCGLETQFICRLEKGHVLPGLDSDGYTTLFEAGFGWLWDRSKTDMVGGPMLKMIEDQPFKNQIVGFGLDGRVGLRDGDLVVNGPKRIGYITSVRYSPLLDKTIGLALVKPHPDFKEGGRLTLWLDRKELMAPIVKPPFYDPGGERMKI